MKKSMSVGPVLLFLIVLYAQAARAQDYNRWNLPDGALMRLGKGDVRDAVWSPNGTRLAVGGSIGIWLYDARTGAQTRLITGHSFRVNAVAFSPDGTSLASGGYSILLWDMSPHVTSQPIATDFDGDGAVGFPDFLQFASQFGQSQEDAGFDARFDLDDDGSVGFNDFVIFARSFGNGT